MDIAGIVLGSLPLVIEALKSTATGYESLRLFSSKRFKRMVDGWILALETQQKLFLNNVLHLISVSDVMGVDENLASTGHDRIKALLSDAAVNDKLNSLLGHNRDIFWKTMKRIEMGLAEIQERMSIECGQVTSTQKAEANFWKDCARKCKLIFREPVYRQLISDLTQANNDLASIKTQVIDLDTSNKHDKQFKRPLARLRKLREDARELLMALTDNWECLCPAPHGLLLCIGHNLEKSSTHFHVAVADFTARYRISTIQCQLQNQPVQISRDLARLGSPQNKARNNNAHHKPLLNASSSVKGKVRFDDKTPSKSPPPSVGQSSPLAGSTQTDDLNDLFCSRNTGSNVVYSCSIKAKGKATVRHDFTCSSTNQASCQSMRLGAACCEFESCTQKNGLSCEFDNTSRITVAAKLAAGVFFLQDTWLRSQWSVEDFIIDVATNNAPTPDDVHLVRDISHTNAPNPKSKHGRILEPLGLALIHILLGQHVQSSFLSTQQTPSAKCQNTLQSPVNEAIEKLYRQYGRLEHSIGEAVSACITWSGPISKDGFDDPDFSLAAYQKVIWPMMKNALMYEGKWK